MRWQCGRWCLDALLCGSMMMATSQERCGENQSTLHAMPRPVSQREQLTRRSRSPKMPMAHGRRPASSTCDGDRSMDPSQFTQVDSTTWRIEPQGAMRVPAIIYAEEALIRD